MAIRFNSHALQIQAPSGNGWDFSPDGGWGIDFGGIGSFGSGFTIGGIGGGGPIGPSTGWDIPGIVRGIAGGLGSAAGGAILGSPVGGVASALGITISWSRIVALLLGLLLIVGGLYLIKPVQTVVNVSAKKVVETAEA